MSEIEIPIGRQEDHRLELKSRAALEAKDRLSIGREVVAMLNADGGEVWIGVAERGGRGVEVEPIPDVERERRSLHDHLVDAIEPPPTQREVRVDAVGRVLRVLANPHPGRGPYGWKGKGGAIYYPVRVADRIRPMTREEQRSAFLGEARHDDRMDEALRRLLDRRAELQREGRERLSLQVSPVPEVSLAGRQDEVVEMLQDPERSGDRRSSAWTVANRFVPPRKHEDGRVTSRWPSSPWDAEDWYGIEVLPDGTIHYEAALERFSHHGARGQRRAEAEPPELWPLAIAELPVSALRLAATLFAGRLGDDDHVIADLSLFGLRGWRLRPGAPRFLGHLVTWDFPEAAAFEGQDLLFTEPLVFHWPEVKANPDRCGFRLVRLVYREFGYGEDAISGGLFDPKSGRLRLAS